MARWRRPSAALAAVAMLAGAAAASGAALSTAGTVHVPARRLEAPAPMLLVSDSAWLGIKTYGAIDAVQGLDHMLDLASCRRRVRNSCLNYDGHVPITLYDEIAWRGAGYDTLVVATGYNDSDHDFESDVATIIELTRHHGYRRVVWLTLRSNVSYTSPGNAGFAAVFERNNRALRDLAASGEFPELVVADWAGYSHDRREWFASDGIHLRVEGPWAAADYVSRKLAFLDGRRCPMPLRAGEAPATPCPDPDLAPPSVDLAGIYPIGQPNPTAGFFMEWQGHGSWPSPPWWQG